MPPKYVHSRTVSASTMAKYLRSAGEFRAWAKQHHRKINNYASLDDALEDYCDFLLFEGYNIAHLQLAVYGVAFDQRLPTRSPLILPKTKQPIKDFKKAKSQHSRDPLPWPLALAVAESLVRHGGRPQRNAAMALLLQYDAYLRPSEVLFLRRRDVHQAGSVVAVTIAPAAPPHQDEPGPTTKASEVDDTVVVVADGASVSANRQVVKTALLSSIALLKPNARLFELELAQYDKHLTEHVRIAGGRTVEFARHQRNPSAGPLAMCAIGPPLSQERPPPAPD